MGTIKKSTITVIFLLLSALSFGQSVNISVSPETGALNAITIDGDGTGMNWILGTNEEQYNWFRPDYQNNKKIVRLVVELSPLIGRARHSRRPDRHSPCQNH